MCCATVGSFSYPDKLKLMLDTLVVSVWDFNEEVNNLEEDLKVAEVTAMGSGLFNHVK